MPKAIFLDRDGVINELVYYPEQGIIDSPFAAQQFRLLPRVGEAINRFHDSGLKVVLVSNQPGIAKGHLSEETFEEIVKRMRDELSSQGASLDGEYYCFHHPEAEVPEFRAICACRKPKPGLILRAAQELERDLNQSWMIGDNLSDVKAGKRAGCRTILLGRMKCELCHLMEKEDTKPEFIAPDLIEAASILFGERDAAPVQNKIGETLEVRR